MKPFGGHDFPEWTPLPFKVRDPSARARENSAASATIEEQLESMGPPECDGSPSCALCADPEELDTWMDWVLEVRVDNRPLTVTLLEAIR